MSVRNESGSGLPPASSAEHQAAETLANRILGAKITSVEEVGNGYVRVGWEHHGTDDDQGCASLPIAAFCFCDHKPCASCWKAADAAEQAHEAKAQAMEP